MVLSDRHPIAFDNPAKMLCRDGNLRVLCEGAYRTPPMTCPPVQGLPIPTIGK